jgi:hypothetical protein
MTTIAAIPASDGRIPAHKDTPIAVKYRGGQKAAGSADVPTSLGQDMESQQGDRFA